MADKDVIDGQVEQGKGKLQNAWGNLTGDVDDQAAGAAKQVGGKIQEAWGRTKDDARAAADNDRVERDTDL